jgi:hypothetical protein
MVIGLMFFCTHDKDECRERIEEVFLWKFPQAVIAEVVEHFANMRKKDDWCAYLSETFRDEYYARLTYLAEVGLPESAIDYWI